MENKELIMMKEREVKMKKSSMEMNE